MDGDYVTRREWDLLLAQVSGNLARLEALDQGGTRGVGVLQLQVSDVIRDQAELAGKMDQHEQSHLAEARRHAEETRDRRRFAITTAIAALVAMIGVYGLLIQIAVTRR